MHHRIRFLALLLLTPSVALGAAEVARPRTGPARLVRDINALPGWDMGSFPRKLHELGDISVFLAFTRATDFELWKTDGTAAGTVLLKDIFPGPNSGFSSWHDTVEFAESGGKLYFVANDGVHGFEPWVTDGTEQGTRMVKDIWPGSSDSVLHRNPYSEPQLTLLHASAGGWLYFVAADGVHGFELWRTDGTEPGTILLGDILAGWQGPFGFENTLSFRAIDLQGTLLFAAFHPAYGIEIWKSDGTEAGTGIAFDLRAGTDSSYPGNFVELNGTILFTAAADQVDSGLWRTNGTAGGTALVQRVYPSNHTPFAPNGPDGYPSATPYVRFGETLLFNVNAVGTDEELWTTDGTTFGTHIVKNIHPQSHSTPRFLADIGGTILFSADDGTHGRELWKTDGTESGTELVADIATGSASGGYFEGVGRIGGVVVFSVDDGIHGQEPYVTDATQDGTGLLADVSPGSASSFPVRLGELDDVLVFETQGGVFRTDGTEAGTFLLEDVAVRSAAVVVGDAFLFGADDGIHGDELWTSDGTPAGTVLLKDVNPLVHTQDGINGVPILPLAGPPTRMLLLGADDGVHGRELWTSDGTRLGTVLLMDIRRGSGSSSPASAMQLGGVWYFRADDGIHGNELWRSDGTEAGTWLVTDLRPGLADSFATPVAVLGSSLLFSASSDSTSFGLWKTDGTDSGTAFLASVRPETNFATTAVLDGVLYFAGYEPVAGTELWRTDGRPTGTYLAVDMYPGMGGSIPNDLTVFRGTIVFTAFGPHDRYAVYRTDGTPGGTTLVGDIGSRNLTGFHELRGDLYYVANDGVHGAELWMTNGTQQGTVMVKDVRPGSAASNPRSLTVVDRTLFFTAASGTGGRSLFASDGTEAGTVMVKPGLNPDGLTAVGGLLLFSGSSPEHGGEPWRSDGTAAGTFEVQDVASGPAGSFPRRFTVVGDRVVFAADDGSTGQEPFVAHVALLLAEPRLALRDLRGQVLALRLPFGLETNLTARLDRAAQELADGRDDDAEATLSELADEIARNTPWSISDGAAGALRGRLRDLVELVQKHRERGRSRPEAAACRNPDFP